MAEVSIPSRRVGDLNKFVASVTKRLVSIPSRRVGDSAQYLDQVDKVVVSIPSRRVGDQGEMRGKAGKRRQKGGRVAVDLR